MIHLVNVNKQMVPSLALATLKSLLRHELNERAVCFDIETDNVPEFSDFAGGVTDGDLVGFTVVSYNIKDVLQYCRVLRDRRSACRIILGGPMVSSIRFSLGLLARHPEIDFIVRGRANDTFPLLVKMLLETEARGLDFDPGLPNLTYRLKAQPFASPDQEQSATNFLSVSPWVEESEYLIDNYMRYGKGPLPYSTGYGCPNRCTYCVEAEQQFALYPLDRVQDELKLILSKKPASIFFYDSVFGYNKTRGLELMAFIAAHNRGTKISVYANISHLDPEYCEAARRANVSFQGIGLQTVDQRTCSDLRRPRQDMDELRRRVNSDFFQCNAGARVGIIYGLPGEGVDEFRETLDFSLSLRANHNLGLYRYCYYPGTCLYEQDIGYEAKSETDPEIVRGPNLTEEDVRRCNRLASFYYVMRDCFPFTLMAMTHIGDRNRADIVERFADRCLPRLTPAMREAAEDVAFANKEDESLASLRPIMEDVTKAPAFYCGALADVILDGRGARPWQREALRKWLGLDLMCRHVLDRSLRLRLENGGRLESLMCGWLGRPRGEASRAGLYRAGRRIGRSSVLQTLCLWAVKLWVKLGWIPGLRQVRGWVVRMVMREREIDEDRDEDQDKDQK